MYYLFYLCGLLLVSVWLLYPLLLKLIASRIDNNSYQNGVRSFDGVTVIIAAHNESVNLKSRCANIFSQSYTGNLEVIIASDGSTDNTKSTVAKLKEEYTNITFIDIQPQAGRSNAHNIAFSYARYEILIFSDAETVFDVDFITNVIRPFENSNVGFVSGVLRYLNQRTSVITESVSIYWRLEMFMRAKESDIGILSTGSGACCAVLKKLYREIPPIGDVDFVTPLDVILQGYKCINASDAVAWDELPESPKQELKARTRMTSKNLSGTISRWGLGSLSKHPIYSLSIFFHKIGRWLTPIFLIGILISNLALVTHEGNNIFFSAILLLQFIFYVLGVVGYFKLSFLYSTQICNFLLANLGFLLGTIQAVTGNAPHQYRPMGQQK